MRAANNSKSKSTASRRAKQPKEEPKKMKTVMKDVKNKAGAVLATIEIEQADSVAECVQLAGGEREAVAIFNREWVTFQMNKHRPRRQGSGAALLVQGFKKLSPEVQNALKGKTAEEISDLLAQLPM
jgi:hypothetical protein